MVTQNRWRLRGDSTHALSGAEASALLHRRLDRSSRETWFEDDRGCLLAVVTNGTRAMVLLTGADGAPGAHLVDPDGEGHSDGFLLSNGQADSYADRDTVTLALATRAVAHLVDHGTWPEDVTVEED